MPERDLHVKVTGDTRGLERAFGRTSTTAKLFGQNVETAGQKVDKSAKAFRNLGTVFAGGLAAGVVFDQLRQSVDVASNLAEQTNKSRQVFEGFSEDVEAFAATSARSFGIARDQALQLAGSFGALFRPLGLTSAEAAKQSVALTQLGADLASFYNTDVQDALLAIQSGLVGQVEPLRRYGVEVSAARVQTQALADTGKSAASELTNQEKVLARIKIIFQDTALAQGDFARTSGGLANQQRILAAEVRDLQASLGGALIPAVTQLVTGMNDAITAGETLAGTLKRVGSAISERDPAFAFFGKFGGFARDVIRYANPVTGSFERTRKALELLGVEFGRTTREAEGFTAAFAKLVTFQPPAATAGGGGGTPGFGEPGFKPKGFEFVTGLGAKAEIELLDAQASGSLRKQLQVLAKQRRTLVSALQQAGLSDEDEVSLRRELAGVTSAMRSINDQIASAAKAQADAVKKAADDAKEARRQATLATRQWQQDWKQANQQLRDAAVERLDLVQTARDVFRTLRDARRALTLAKRIGGRFGIEEARENLQDAQLARQRLRLQGVTFAGSPAGGVNQQFGNVQITIASNQDPVKIAQQVLAELRKKSKRGSPSPLGRQPGERIGGV